MIKRDIVVTSALPYANGRLHLGHVLETIQADIWVRMQRENGHACVYVCGEDAHGTAIMLSAEKAHISPEQWIAECYQQHQRDFADFHINFDNFYTTHSPENQQLSCEIFEKLQKNGDIEHRTVAQAFDTEKNIFLPDRYIKGECPRCGASDQYGDNCEQCGATYSPSELKNSVSVISGSKPITKESEHLFFQLANYSDLLQKWSTSGALQPEITHKLDEWFQSGLRAWDISRDAPYFGFEIPNHPNKYFYVWLDAPVGYMASHQQLCQRLNLNFNNYWQADSTTELYHFIGKDIVYFHALFWPAMLAGSGFRLPTAIFTHGFLTVDGQKMSKSRGTFIKARTYLDYLNPEYLRYYFASKLSGKIQDIDLNWQDFQTRINSELVGKFINIASRCAKFINQHFENQLAVTLDRPELYEQFSQAHTAITEYYQQLEYTRVIRTVMELADIANQYIDEKKPWQLSKQNPQDVTIQNICTTGLNLFRLLMIYLKPVLPQTATRVAQFLNDSLSWQQCQQPLLKHAIQPFQPLMQRVDNPTLVALQQAAQHETVA